MSIYNTYYYIPSGVTKEISTLIEKEFSAKDLKTSTIKGKNIKGNSSTIDTDVRKSKNFWIPTDHWVSGMMSHFINCANLNLFNYDLITWNEKIQYTVYEGKGSHYTWHNDFTTDTYVPEMIRKLSISMCLSSKDEYEGGEFQIMISPRKMETFSMDIGDVIIFPSDVMHRVRPLKAGKRVSLVGWYGGPPFK
jgi:PKHD-type hydroxylase